MKGSRRGVTRRGYFSLKPPGGGGDYRCSRQEISFS